MDFKLVQLTDRNNNQIFAISYNNVYLVGSEFPRNYICCTYRYLENNYELGPDQVQLTILKNTKSKLKNTRRDYKLSEFY